VCQVGCSLHQVDANKFVTHGSGIAGCEDEMNDVEDGLEAFRKLVDGGHHVGDAGRAIFFLARVMRAAMVGSDTRNARATSGVVSPHISRKVSAIRPSTAMAGWQQVKTSRSRSSGISVNAVSTATSTASVSVASLVAYGP